MAKLVKKSGYFSFCQNLEGKILPSLPQFPLNNFSFVSLLFCVLGLIKIEKPEENKVAAKQNII